MAARKKKQLTRTETRDKAKQYDTQYMGEEPSWEGVVFETEQDRRIAKIRTLNWYNYFKSEMIAYRKDVRKWIKANRKDLDANIIAVYIQSMTAARLMCMNTAGWELSESELQKINEAIDDALTNHDRNQNDPEAEGVTPTRKRVTPIPKMLESLDDWEDRHILGEQSGFDVKAHYEEFKDSKTSLDKYVRPWVEHRLDDLENHWSNEEYPFGVKERNRLIKVYKQMLKDLDEVTEIKRTKRRKKPMTKARQAKGFVCLAESAEFNVKSLDPKDIIGKERVFLFNEKYRTLTELVALAGGFSGKGMEITNVDMAKSRSTKLRKPLDMLPKVCNNALRTIHKEWSGLTTKTTEANPRLNRNTVVLRIM